MYKTQAETRAFFAALKPLVAGSTHCDIVVAPPYTALAAAVEAVPGSAISIAPPEAHWGKEGGLTRRGFPKMPVGGRRPDGLIRHSQRPQYFRATDEAG